RLRGFDPAARLQCQPEIVEYPGVARGACQRGLEPRNGGADVATRAGDVAQVKQGFGVVGNESQHLLPAALRAIRIVRRAGLTEDAQRVDIGRVCREETLARADGVVAPPRGERTARRGDRRRIRGRMNGVLRAARRWRSDVHCGTAAARSPVAVLV